MFCQQSLNDVLIQTTTRTQKNECGICKFKEGSVEAKVFCVECKIELCDDCARAHNEAKVTEGHTLLRQQGGAAGGVVANRDNYCRIHKGDILI